MPDDAAENGTAWAGTAVLKASAIAMALHAKCPDMVYASPVAPNATHLRS